MNHEPHSEHAPVERAERRPLAIALAITAIFLVVEAAGGLLTGSLALLADAGHMLTDVAALALALFAIWLAQRPATPTRSFGYLRAEVLAALANAAALIAISLLIFWEAIRRLGAPPEVDSGPMLVVAIAGLLANATSAWVLSRGGGHRHNLNTRGAFLHVISDMLGSAGAIVAALVMLATGWYLADPLLSAGIGLLVLWNAWRLLRESVDVLLEATPPEIDPAAVRDALGEIDGIEGIHDLHVWTVTSGLVALSSHVEVAPGSDWDRLLPEASDLLADRFGVGHITLQPETVGALPDAFRGCSLDSPEGVLACRSRVDRAAPPAHAGHRH
ncbi:MAG TPA: cation diffusion facilitator family transporter [Thermomicrobiales bacterium]|nr:cation diffusion facilitator family transporter [Thermomicrobiales bacterium]HRA32587.1 cation diffusion facilitator family transporter [Thermomicrobiales bacterium]